MTTTVDMLTDEHLDRRWLDRDGDLWVCSVAHGGWMVLHEQPNLVRAQAHATPRPAFGPYTQVVEL